MSEPWVETVCFLCGAPASLQQMNGRQRYHYVCRGTPPGDYLITGALWGARTEWAMKELEQSPGSRAAASALAHREYEPEDILDISVDFTTHQVIHEVLKRRDLGISCRVV
jgi:hypothetical protein